MANYQKFTAITEWSREVTPRVWVARFALENPKEMDFLAGQYCSFKLSESIRRTFSISTSPEEKHAFEICADIRPMGPGSVWLMNLKPGDPVEFVGPLGKFVIDRESPRDRVFIATGTGIAPIRSMIYETLESNGKFKGKSFLFWGLRYEDDLFWQDEFEKLAQNYEDFTYTLTISRPTENWQGNRGYVSEHFDALGLGENYDFYLCGYRIVIDKVKEVLFNRMVPVSRVKTELFF